MTDSDEGNNGAATAAMFAVILITRLTIAFATDWPSAVGWGVSIIAGIVTAGVAWQLTRRQTRRKPTE